MESKLVSRAQQEPAVALAAANKRFEEALLSARHIMYRLNVLEGGYDYLSPFFTELTGYPVDEFTQITFQQLPDYFHPDDRERIFGENGALAHAFKSRVDNKSFLLVEYRFLKADGSYCWLRDQSTVYFGADGTIDSIVGAAYDITEQKKLIHNLQEHEARLGVLLESSLAGISMVDPSGRVVMANNRMAEMFGCTMDELIGSSYMSHVHPEQRAVSGQRLQQILSGEIDHLNAERLYIRKDGSEFWGYLSCRRHIDAEGKLIALIGYMTDISELKQSEEALKASESKFRTLIECSTDVIFVLDLKGTFRFASPAWEKHFGFPVSEILGKNFAPFVHPDDIQPCLEHLQQIMTTGQAATSPPYRVRHADGSWRYFIANGTLFTDISGENRYLGVARDITGQKQAEDERLSLERQLLNAQKLESLGVLAGGIAHDFNNILTAIMGNISYARTGLAATSAAATPLERAEKAAQRAAKLARQLLVFAKGGEPVKRFFLLQQTITEAVSLVLSGTNVQAVFDLPTDLYAVNADEGQINQAFHNIILNSVQAMPDGGRLFISGSNAAVTADNNLGLTVGDYVKIAIRDEGCGIAAEDLGKVFDPYFTNKSGGSGLGLASTYTIIKKHSGHISVSSHPGKGAVFTVMLPGLGKPDPAESRNYSATVNSHETGSILVMDDDEMVRELAEIMLKRLGYTVLSCANGAEAVSLYQAAKDEGTPFSLCILDLTIPGGMGGIETARQILAIDPAAKLIVSSGYSDDPVMADFTAYGFCAALEKPYNVKEIDRILQKNNR